MSSFMTHLKVEVLEEENRYKVAEEFTYKIGGEDSLFLVHVPVGFETDFASIPRIFWAWLPPTGKYGKAAVVHDYMYRKRCKFSRVVADAVFLDAMETLKVPKLRRFIIYLGVRCFGWLFFNVME